MKKNAYLLILLIPAYFLLSYSSGAPFGYSGSPGDNGRTCTQCHTADGNSYMPSIALQNFPATYQPGQTYRIHLTVGGTSNSKFGFEATVEDNNHQKQGVFGAVSGSTQAIQNNTYITHTSSSTTAGDWLFDWTAPAAGHGTLKMYYAINLANGNGQSTGDYVQSDFAEMQEDVSNLTEIKKNKLEIYPNPAVEIINIKNLEMQDMQAEAIDMAGRIYPLHKYANRIYISHLPKGNYVLKLKNDKIAYTKTFIKK